MVAQFDLGGGGVSVAAPPALPSVRQRPHSAAPARLAAGVGRP
jgi:hypothetical protein